jgi:hypothetical protein
MKSREAPTLALAKDIQKTGLIRGNGVSWSMDWTIREE